MLQTHPKCNKRAGLEKSRQFSKINREKPPLRPHNSESIGHNNQRDRQKDNYALKFLTIASANSEHFNGGSTGGSIKRAKS